MWKSGFSDFTWHPAIWVHVDERWLFNVVKLEGVNDIWDLQLLKDADDLPGVWTRSYRQISLAISKTGQLDSRVSHTVMG